MSTETIIEEVKKERNYQLTRWGNEFDDTHSPYEWAGFITQYATKDLTKYHDRNTDLGTFRNDMVKVATLAVAAIEAIDRKAV